MKKINMPRDLEYLIGSFLVLIAILKIVFINEDIFAVAKLAISFFWIFVLPGLPVTYIYRKINFIERFALASLIGAVLTGIGTYYTGLLGIHIKYSILLLPAIYILLGLFAIVIGGVMGKKRVASATASASD